MWWIFTISSSLLRLSRSTFLSFLPFFLPPLASMSSSAVWGTAVNLASYVTSASAPAAPASASTSTSSTTEDVNVITNWQPASRTSRVGLLPAISSTDTTQQSTDGQVHVTWQARSQRRRSIQNIGGQNAGVVGTGYGAPPRRREGPGGGSTTGKFLKMFGHNPNILVRFWQESVLLNTSNKSITETDKTSDQPIAFRLFFILLITICIFLLLVIRLSVVYRLHCRSKV